MTDRKQPAYLVLLMAIAAAVLFFSGCFLKSRPEFAEEPIAQENPLAIVRSGEIPLWFELRPGGPVRIADPSEASEEPFVPWPRSRHIAAMAAEESGRLIMAVNRDGFLVWEPRADGLALYRVTGAEDWEPYTVASLFSFRGTPAILLYREDFFEQDEAEAPAVPLKRMWGLAENSLEMTALDIPAFSALPAEEGWDLEALRFGRDGNWYYRGLRKGSPRELRYFRTADLAIPGEIVSAGLFRTAMNPYTNNDMPFPIRMVLDEAGRMAGEGKLCVAAMVSPDFPALRRFSLESELAGPGPQEPSFRRERSPIGLPRASGFLGSSLPDWPAELGEMPEPVEIAGYYQAPGRAAAVFPDGRGVYVLEGVLPFALPSLPEGFVYTRIGFAGAVLIAGWEEQQDWLVGAAGFMVINGPWS
jgi:hypothetical protein